MASTKEYLDFVLEQLSDLDEVSLRAMMGEYILYYHGKVVGGVYDDRFLVKPTKTAVAMMPDADMELPYDGAKKMLLFSYLEGFYKKKIKVDNGIFIHAIVPRHVETVVFMTRDFASG